MKISQLGLLLITSVSFLLTDGYLTFDKYYDYKEKVSSKQDINLPCKGSNCMRKIEEAFPPNNADGTYSLECFHKLEEALKNPSLFFGGQITGCETGGFDQDSDSYKNGHHHDHDNGHYEKSTKKLQTKKTQPSKHKNKNYEEVFSNWGNDHDSGNGYFDPPFEWVDDASGYGHYKEKVSSKQDINLPCNGPNCMRTIREAFPPNNEDGTYSLECYHKFEEALNNPSLFFGGQITGCETGDYKEKVSSKQDINLPCKGSNCMRKIEEAFPPNNADGTYSLECFHKLEEALKNPSLFFGGQITGCETGVPTTTTTEPTTNPIFCDMTEWLLQNPRKNDVDFCRVYKTCTEYC